MVPMSNMRSNRAVTFAEQTFGIDGKVALVTGGYSGIGAAVSLGLAQMGAKIAVAGYEGEKAAEWARSLQSRGHDAMADTFNVLSPGDTQRMVDTVSDRFGRVDILVNCVGVNREEKAEDITEELFDPVIDVNLKGAALAMVVTASDEQYFTAQQVGKRLAMHPDTVTDLFRICRLRWAT